MQESIHEMFDYQVIHEAPVYTLAECLAAEYRSAEHGEEEEEESRKHLIEQFRICMNLFDEKDLDFLLMAEEMLKNRGAWQQNVAYQPFLTFWRLNLAYLFESGGEHHLVVPEELIAIYREVSAGERFAETLAENRERMAYADALTEIYGQYTIAQFVTVWNHHHREKITEKEGDSFLEDYEGFRAQYYLDEDYVVHDALDEEDFEDLWEATKDLPYYMPTKSEIRAYAAKVRSHEPTPAYNEVDALLREYLPDAGNIDDTVAGIVIACEALDSPAEIQSFLEDDDILMTDPKFRERFERLVNRIQSAAHIWKLRGHTPYQYQRETGEAIPAFRLPPIKKKHKG